MRKSTHSPEHQHLQRTLIALRKSAGLTQRALAEKLDREYSFVWRIEAGERRLDAVEFYWVCTALGFDARAVYRALVDCIETNVAPEHALRPMLRRGADRRFASRRAARTRGA